MTARRPHQSTWSIYRHLVWLGIVIAAGLASALLGDFWWDYLSWALVLVPIVLFGYFIAARDRKT